METLKLDKKRGIKRDYCQFIPHLNLTRAIMDKNTGNTGQYTTVGELFDKTIDKMFQDKNFLARCGKQETSSSTTSLNNSQGQVSKIISTLVE